jgi:hypothetical protein
MLTKEQSRYCASMTVMTEHVKREGVCIFLNRRHNKKKPYVTYDNKKIAYELYMWESVLEKYIELIDKKYGLDNIYRMKERAIHKMFLKEAYIDQHIVEDLGSDYLDKIYNEDEELKILRPKYEKCLTEYELQMIKEA